MSSAAVPKLSKPLPGSGAKPPAPGKETEALLKRAKRGDEKCLPQVRALLANGDRGRSFIDDDGSSAEWLRQVIAKVSSGGDILAREAVMRKIDKVRAELEGPSPTPIERLLAERAAFCWFIVNFYEAMSITAGPSTLAQANHRQRQIDRAHKRFLSAVETLARVRKMALPMLQVNVAKNQQINTVANAAEK